MRTISYDYRLYMTTVIKGRPREEGAYYFPTEKLAYEFLKDQASLVVLRAELWYRDKLIARADNADLKPVHETQV